MKFVFIYLIFSFSLFLANIASSQESGVKEIIKRQQVKIQLIENNLKSLIGKLESKTQTSSQDKSIINKLNDIETKLGKITSQFKNLSEFAYALEFKINRIETNLNLSPALKSYKNNEQKPKKDTKQNIVIKSEGLEPKTPGVLGYVKSNDQDKANKPDLKNDNLKNKVKTSSEVLNNYPKDASDHFKIAEDYLLKDLEKAKLAFENFIIVHKENEKVVDAEYWLGRILFMQKKYSQAALALAEFNGKYPDDKRYEQTTLLIADATSMYAPKDVLCKILKQTYELIDNPSKKFVKKITELKKSNSCIEG